MEDLRLARPASGITLEEVLEAVGEWAGEKECVFGFTRCDARNCPLHPAYSQLTETVKAWPSGRRSPRAIHPAAARRALAGLTDLEGPG